jgi:glycosyltransferase involved in cell wall biosynthesis
MSSNEKSNKTRPRFSVIITFHNQRGFIKDALMSALAQRNAEFEIIVVDDASSDGSREFLEQYRDKVRLLCLETNAGACEARNRGAALAAGEYLVFLDGDDAFLPWALDVYERIVQAKSPKMILASMKWFEGQMPSVDEAPSEISIVDYGDYLRRDRAFGHSASALVVERQSFQDVQGWLVGSFPLEDAELALRLGAAGRTILVLTPPTIWHRAHSSNTINNVSSFMPAMEALLKRERSGFYPGGANRGFERRALIGGMAFHWTKRAVKSGLHKQAMKLLAYSSPMVLTGGLRRLGMLLGARQDSETIKM